MQRVASLAELAEDSGLGVEVGGRPILLVRSGRQVRAFAGECPHAGARLADGAVCRGWIICPWHKAMFSAESGALLEPPALAALTRYQVSVDGDDVLVGEALDEAADAARPGAAQSRPIAVVVGAGAAGAAGAAALREFGFDGRIVLIGREGELPYDRTVLSKFVLSGEMEASAVPGLLPPAAWCAQGVEHVAQSVTRLDVVRRRAMLADGSSFGFDMALVAPGASPTWPALPGRELAGVFTLRETMDAVAILHRLGTASAVVVQGGSFIGLEAAAAMRQAGAAVTVVMPEALPFEKQMGPRLAAMFKALHERHGVVFKTGTTVARLEGSTKLERAILADGTSLAADLMVIGVGVSPDTGFVEGLTLEADGGIAVDERMQAGAGIWAAGDAARFPLGGGDWAATERTKIEHWRVAQQTARIAARNMAGGSARYEGVPFFWTYFYGKRFEFFGHAPGPHEVLIDGDLEAGRFVALLADGERVAGVLACERERATAHLLAAMREGLPVTGAQAIVARY